MKIAMLIDWWNPPIFWWWQVHVEELCKWLTKNHDCKVDLFVRKLKWDDWKIYNKDTKEGKWHVYRVWPTTKFFNTFWRILCLATTTFYLLYKTIKEKYDIIHAHAYVSWLPAKIVWFLTRTPVVYTVHWTMWLDASKKWLLARVEKRLICGIKYDLEISVSNKIFNYKNVNKDIKVIYNWVDTEKYNNVNQPERYKWINLIWVGRFDWQKWLIYLVDWLKLINKNLLKEKWFHVNLVWDWELFNEVKWKVKEYWLNDFVSFKWKLFWDDLIKEYKSNQIFILPSLAEWQPLTLLEAMACWLPTLVTDVWDNKYFVENWRNWFIFNSWDEKSVADNIIKILNSDDSEIKKMWDYNFEFSKKYDWKNVVNNVFNEYKNLVNK